MNIKDIDSDIEDYKDRILALEEIKKNIGMKKKKKLEECEL